MTRHPLRRLCAVLQPAFTPLAAALLLGACASTPPTRFYSLVPAPPAAPRSGTAADFRIDVRSVSIPAQVDVPQLVVRLGPEELTQVETRRWISPLPNEIRDAVAAELGARLGVRDIHGLGSSADSPPVYRLALAVQRFDSALGAYARIDVLWSITPPGTEQSTSCFSSINETVSPGYEALAAGHQRALVRLADSIALALTAARQGKSAACPPS
jgi:uncharacterized lipoprotein YmbA